MDWKAITTDTTTQVISGAILLCIGGLATLGWKLWRQWRRARAERAEAARRLAEELRDRQALIEEAWQETQEREWTPPGGENNPQPVYWNERMRRWHEKDR